MEAVDGATITAGTSAFVVRRLSQEQALIAADGLGGFVLNRLYRIRPESRPVTVEFPTPPATTVKRPFPWIATLLPLVVAVALAAVLRQPTFLLFAVLSPVSLVASQWSERRSDARQRQGSDTSYGERRLDAERRVASALADEEARWRGSLPSFDEVLTIVAAPLRGCGSVARTTTTSSTSGWVSARAPGRSVCVCRRVRRL